MAGATSGGETAVTVFVDDAVLGRFPRVSARTGEPSDGRLTIHADVGRDGGGLSTLVFVVLLFAGPLGWLAILFFGSGTSTDHLSVQVPWTIAAHDRLVALRRRRTVAAAAACAATAAVIGLVVVQAGSTGMTLATDTLLALAAAAALGAAGVAVANHWRVGREQVGVDLDASRRWVTLSNVHPAFVRAVRADHQRRRAATP